MSNDQEQSNNAGGVFEPPENTPFSCIQKHFAFLPKGFYSAAVWSKVLEKRFNLPHPISSIYLVQLHREL